MTVLTQTPSLWDRLSLNTTMQLFFFAFNPLCCDITLPYPMFQHKI